MSRKKDMFIILLAVAVLVSLTVGIVTAAPVTQSINYQGKLTDAAGNPLTGTYSVTFRLYSVSTGGTALVTDTHTVQASKGLFTTQITFDAGYFIGDARWVGITVGSDAEMTPRQEIRPVPYALSLRPGAIISGSGMKTGLTLLNSGNAIIGLNATSTGPNSIGVYANAPDNGSNGIQATSSGNGAVGIAAYASGTDSTAIWADYTGSRGKAISALASGDGSTGAAIASTGANSTAIYGEATGFNSNAIVGVAMKDSSWAGNFYTAGAGSAGVHVDTTGSGSQGILAYTHNTGSQAVYGNSEKDVGVYGVGSLDTGVKGTGRTGVNGTGTLTGVFGYGKTGVIGISSDTDIINTGVFGEGKNYGVRGKSTSGVGVDGHSTSNDGVFGDSTSAYGVHGLSASSHGVHGESTTSTGIYGTGNTGIYGLGTAYGVWGQSTSQVGVQGHSPGGTGVRGSSISGNGVEGIGSTGLIGTCTSGGTGLIAKGPIDGTGKAAIFQGNVLIKNSAGNTDLLEFGEGLDYSEGFDVVGTDSVTPGTVLVISTVNPGELTISSEPYDHKVAGIVTGANGLGSAVKVGGDQFDTSVALAGRVYCNVDATYGSVKPGDQLTTSITPGYAMVVQDHTRAQGATIGKAMEGLEKGKGQILVLVTLQ